MSPEQIAKEHRYYLEGLLEDETTKNLPDGAWFQINLDKINWAQRLGDLPAGDEHDIFMAWLELEETEK